MGFNSGFKGLNVKVRGHSSCISYWTRNNVPLERNCILEKSVTQWQCGMYKFIVEIDELNIQISVGCVLYTFTGVWCKISLNLHKKWLCVCVCLFVCLSVLFRHVG